MTNYIISRIAGAAGMFGTFVMMLGFLGAMMSTSSVFIGLAAGGLVTVGICRFFMIEE
jgi:hypothetical protein